MIVLPTVAVQLAVWLAVIVRPGPAPLLWLLVLLAVALASGGPASMVAFEHARAHNPQHRLSTASAPRPGSSTPTASSPISSRSHRTGARPAGRRVARGLHARPFRWAFLMQVPLWLLGTALILRERRLARRKLGLDRPRR